MSRTRQQIQDYDATGALLLSLQEYGNRVVLPMTLKTGMQRTYKTKNKDGQTQTWANTKKFLPLSVLPPKVNELLMTVLRMDEEGELRDHVEAAKKAAKGKGPKRKSPITKRYINIHALQSLCLLPTRMIWVMLKMMEELKQCAADLPDRVKNAAVEANLIEEVVQHLRMTLAGLAGSLKEAEDATADELMKMCPVYCHQSYLVGMRNHIKEAGTRSCIPLKTKKDRLTIREHGKRLVQFSEQLQSFFGFCGMDFTENYKAKKVAEAAELADANRRAGLTQEERDQEDGTKALVVVQRPQVAVPRNELKFASTQIVFCGTNKELVNTCAQHKKDIHLVFVNMEQEISMDSVMEMAGLMRDCADDNFTAIFLLPEDGEVMKKRVESTMKSFGKDKVILHYNTNNTNHPNHTNAIGFYYKPAPDQLKPRCHPCTAEGVGVRERNWPYADWPHEVSAKRSSGRIWF